MRVLMNQTRFVYKNMNYRVLKIKICVFPSYHIFYPGVASLCPLASQQVYYCTIISAALRDSQ